MIAANLRKYPDAMIRQLELDLAGVAEAAEPQREAFWEWLMATGLVIVRKVAIPAWWMAMRERASKLARAVKQALASLF